jgi:hypothetical protein
MYSLPFTLCIAVTIRFLIGGVELLKLTPEQRQL